MFRFGLELLIVGLVGLGLVVGRPSLPPPIGKNASLLQTEFDRICAEDKGGHLTIKAGTYVFSNKSLEINNCRHLSVQGNGAIFLFYIGFGISINNCKNVTLQGLTLDSDPPNYAQGRVTHVDPNTASFTSTFDEDFLMPDTSTVPFNAPGGSAGAKIMFWSANTRLPSRQVHFLKTSKPANGVNSWQIEVKGSLSSPPPKIGNLVTVFPRRGFTWLSYNSSGVVADSIVIHAGGNMGFLEMMGDGGHLYRNVSIVRKPGSRGLMALNADGFHSNSVRVGPTLENSEISFTGDDHLNIHASMLVVCKGIKPNQLAIIDPSDQVIVPGDTLSFYKLLSSMPGHPPGRLNPFLANAIVKDIRKATDPSLIQDCQKASQLMGQPPYNAWLIVSTLNSPVYVVDFETPLSPSVVSTRYNLVSLDSNLCANAKVRGNYFHDSCGSGGRILLKSRNATFEKNIAERFGGIHIITEQEWLEGDLGIGNIVLDSNYIEDQDGFLTHVDVMPGMVNVTCENTTFVEHGKTTHRSEGC